MEKRPKGVTFVAVIVFIAAALALIVGISTIIPGTPLDFIWTVKNSFPVGFRSTTTGMIFGYFILILGLIMIGSGYGLLKGKKWAWLTVLIIFLINGIGDAISVAYGGGINGVSGILIAFAFLIYLTRPHVKEFFSNETIHD
ncbi:MAG: hypothetical protein WAL81_02275 [Methanobacterium sp.]